MDREYPKNVRQIGNVSDCPRIYVEDYVDTYLNQLADPTKEKMIGILLMGDILEKETEKVVFVSGALAIPEITIGENEITIEKDIWERMQGEKQVFFEKDKMVGWCLLHNGQVCKVDRRVQKFHEKYFREEDTVFVLKDGTNSEESFYAKKYGDLMEMGGHYIFYEKNPSMQNYLIMSRKKIGVTPSEVVEDRAAKNFRSTIKEKMEEKERRQSARWMYAFSTLLVVIVLGIGIVMLNNYENIETVQSALQTDHKKPDKKEEKEEKDEKEEKAIEVKPEVQQPEQKELVKVEEEQIEENNRANTDYYTVKRGDTLENISVNFYGSKKMIGEICNVNGLTDGNLIIEGQKLLLP